MPDRKIEYGKSKEQAKLDCGAVFGLANKCVIKKKDVVKDRNGS